MFFVAKQAGNSKLVIWRSENNQFCDFWAEVTSDKTTSKLTDLFVGHVEPVIDVGKSVGHNYVITTTEEISALAWWPGGGAWTLKTKHNCCESVTN